MSATLSESSIAARLERLPMSPWHRKIRLIIGTATFFDAFDSVTIAFVLPALIGPWSLNPGQIGNLIAIGFIGQALGAFVVGMLAERIGRVPATMISIGIFCVMSLFCAFAQNYEQLFAGRFLQGLGLGAEIPIAAAYVNEIAKAKSRGKFFMLYESVFTAGVVAVSIAGAVVVPRFGYQWMFILGFIPALLLLPLRRLAPESPRWLASRGRLADADRILTKIEEEIARTHPLPPADTVNVAVRPHDRTRASELFQGIYLQRTIVTWILWFTTFLFSYGLIAWLPTIYRTVYKLSVQEALLYGIVSNVFALFMCVVCAFMIDWTGRRPWITIGLFVSSVPMFILWWLGLPSLAVVVTLAAFGSGIITSVGSVMVMYTPEMYPTRLRALGTSWATFWLRFSSVIGAYVVGQILPTYGTAGVFLLFGCLAVIGGVVCWAGGTETQGKVLEEVSP